MRYNTILLLFAFKITGVFMLRSMKHRTNKPIIMKPTSNLYILNYPLSKTETWDDGEVPWDLKNDNFTNVSVITPPRHPLLPSAALHTLVYEM
jgi:hypothetical protein